ncbi:uncharacterized protein LACBIDRAFT_332394 [Laccaria bicolor S238N-H82]|uniref:Predicted protein n=1 Tax=Laccaria bicolor (strain S238N-H82 / ATCC MYA-4686) TaxID=486041 RepID=B0DSK6_LACBS|nr:uncharacterized protein LACBIDRAFT_332394 [Laccaria bicolor S238N-H82]EDR02565.1 predicted protein [Laccaria bicolor S238N-H82]|eukprot:XP_001886928.1 predicted protein [Laccaria bicolor S238N-H82]
MPPHLCTSTLKTASAPVVVESTSSGHARTLSLKQQQLDTDKALKQASAKDKAYTQALRVHQAQEASMGYQAILIQAPAPPSAAANADGLEPESEDDENQPAVHSQGFTSVTLQPIIKTSVPTGGPSKNLVRQVSGQPPQASPSIIPAAGPYSPNSVSLYGQGDGTYYTKERRHMDAEDSDDEFGTKLSGVTYPQPTEYRYPQVHPDLEAFPRSMTEAILVKPTKAVTPATNPHIRKDCPVTPAPSTTMTARASQDLKEHKGIYRHPAFQTIINKNWFKNKRDNGVIHPEFSEGGMLSKVTKALAITVVENCLDEWQTGEHIDVPFTTAAYKPKFTTNLKQLIVFDNKTKESNIVPCLLKHMLKMARKLFYGGSIASCSYNSFECLIFIVMMRVIVSLRNQVRTGAGRGWADALVVTLFCGLLVCCGDPDANSTPQVSVIESIFLFSSPIKVELRIESVRIFCPSAWSEFFTFRTVLETHSFLSQLAPMTWPTNLNVFESLVRSGFLMPSGVNRNRNRNLHFNSYLSRFFTKSHETGLPNTNAAYGLVKTLKDFHKNTKEDRVMPCLRQHLLGVACIQEAPNSKHAKVVDTTAVRPIQLRAEDFAAAREEWKDVMFSDE